ncbi:hypothetical protein XA68_13597 [Ophiocordyceps unilateralis]|uniref:Heterokaryon incompatibility domain-containing protein n=1 Tax=Ophiocordyceps unilateralis TaxID=268505 RepID=A0A2A9PAQ9_OPHUN|nr:hypothetical protein XA68_13597 [Ophiocordyceps unilateralis]
MSLPYDRLKHGEIRLLRLTRVIWKDEASTGLENTSLALITCSLRLGIPSFTALSYVWGDPADTVRLSYSGGTVSVTRNLGAILDCLVSSISENTFLWIDALCINQTDLRERAEQVSLMGQIYSQASPVLVFLSTISTPFEVGLSFLRQTAEHPDRHYEPSLQPHITLPSDLDAHSETLRDSVVAVFAAPWWTRVWTVQEFVLAGRVVFRCGHEEIDEATLLAALASLRDHESGCCWAARREANGDSKGYINLPSSANGGLSLFQATLRLDQLHVMRNAQAFDARSLLGALAMFRTRQCVDPRDHIFGMLGLDLGNELETLKARIKIDYTITPAELFADVACAMVHLSHNLDVLSHICQYPSARGRLKGLPSWVPDWTATVDETFHHWYSERTRRTALTNATADSRAVWERRGGEGVVSTKAITIGSITTTAPGYPNSSSSLSGPTLLDRWRELFDCRCNDLDGELAHDGTGHTEAAKSTDSEFGQMISGCYTRKDWVDEPGRHDEAFRDWCYWLTHEDPKTLSEIKRQNARGFDHLAKTTALERRMFLTDNGRVGFGPEAAEEGDLVILMAGGRVPFIVRHASCKDGGSHYQLLGDAFLYGAMLGEACRKLQISQGWDDLLLR